MPRVVIDCDVRGGRNTDAATDDGNVCGISNGACRPRVGGIVGGTIDAVDGNGAERGTATNQRRIASYVSAVISYGGGGGGRTIFAKITAIGFLRG